MSNLTITVDAEALKKARLRALAQGTSVNAVLREFLEAYAGVRGEHHNAARQIIALSRAVSLKAGTMVLEP